MIAADLQDRQPRARARCPVAAGQRLEVAGDHVRPDGRRRRVAERPLAPHALLVVEVRAPVVDVGEEHRQLDEPALRRRPHGVVGLVARVRGRRVEDANVQVGEQEDGDDRRRATSAGTRRASFRRRAQSIATATSAATAEAGDGEHPLGHARVAERREDVPERAVHRVVRAEREQDRHGGADAERDGEPATPRPGEEDEPGDRDERGQPAEEDERLRRRGARAG